ncbi:MAG TPA: alpha-amylase [Planctomycetaceae bacterium]|nr:alpha-amylase [Planctomycetaceae bacterium]
MAGTVRLILAFHNHQPIGNFDGVFEQAYEDSYLPFLDTLEQYPEIRFALHTSGSLLEWLESAHPEYINRVRTLVTRGQVEIIGGAYYEPILANIPRRDRIGQIRMYTDHLQNLFQTDVRGMWIPERVWEQSFTGDVTAAGIKYTILDDHHFRAGGLEPEELSGYYLTEDEGRLLSVFPGSEHLRYLIPFREPHETIDFLRHVANNNENPIVVFGDDGEKFGTWPETYRHVYEDRWLKRFLTALQENSSWINVTTPSETLDHVPPRGTFYIPDASYREMTEWSLPTGRQAELSRLSHQERHDDADWENLKTFSSGGFWRNFRVKYPESNEMYTRALGISAQIEELEQTLGKEHGVLQQATRCLYRAQCNCSYWHGAFGGLYLPHLRNAVYASLIEADNLLQSIIRQDGPWVDYSLGDFNLDGRKEVLLSNHRMAAFFAPACGGQMYELDLRNCHTNLLATLNRREEAYHQTVIDHAEHLREHGEQQEEQVNSIHDLVRFKQPDLDRKIAYDNWPRKSLIDHFMQPNLALDDFHAGHGLLGRQSEVSYEGTILPGEGSVTLEMKGRAEFIGAEVEVTKSVTLSEASPNEVQIRYQLDGLPLQVPVHFGVEFNFASMPGGASDRYYYDTAGMQLGTLDMRLDLKQTSRLGLVDEWQGVDVSLESSQEADIWTFPIETISQSESGFELVHQSVAVVPHWQFAMEDSSPWIVELTLNLDTSLAQARKLAEMGSERDTSDNQVPVS